MKLKVNESDTSKTAKSSTTEVHSVAVMENEPRPMKSNKPVQKHPNAVDKFRVTHQTEYEGEEPPERCRLVDSHNAACPKLKDELDKRRSTSRPIAEVFLQCTSGNQTAGWFDPKCRNCAKLESERKMQSKTRSFQRRPRASRVTKRKSPQCRKKIMVHKALSMVSEVTNVGRKESSCSRDGKKSVDPNLKYPDTSAEPSVTSYHSFWSTDHEPMG